MRELVINAFAHRSYLEHDAPVFLAVYDNRVEITSPGGLPRGQTADRALAGYSKIRNDVLAKVLNYMRYIEEWGSGLRRVNRVLAEYGIRPVVLDEAAFATQMNVYRNAEIALKHEGNEGNREDNAQAIDLLLAKLKLNPRVSVRQLASELPISKATVERGLHKLQSAGRIRRKGGTRGVWEVLA